MSLPLSMQALSDMSDFFAPGYWDFSRPRDAIVTLIEAREKRATLDYFSPSRYFRQVSNRLEKTRYCRSIIHAAPCTSLRSISRFFPPPTLLCSFGIVARRTSAVFAVAALSPARLRSRGKEEMRQENRERECMLFAPDIPTASCRGTSFPIRD